ncbi:hypothetical protein OE88DRAFT_1731132 [Heliocybe sulcata]|uniref:RING-type domain-containing protein n=1 Tax=Heliocybe sulcata TaxID=5364 RepID=A0A5C3NG39_9AGAM|nr:hypothetical protein OE88DRAFT_1731132 [Heliocybe sulcata]
MARTRSSRLISSAHKDASIPAQELSAIALEPGSNGSETEGSNEVERYLSKAQAGLRRLKEQYSALKTENEELKAEVDKLLEAQDVSIQPKRGKKGGPTAATLQAEIRKLKRDVHSLEGTREKLKKRVKQLEVKEAKREAAELNDEAEDTADDSAHHMRKLLRTFQDLISETVLAEDEECIICMEKLKPEEASSFPCEHVVCNTCLPQIAPGSEVINCPQCRTQWKKTDIETVHRTASQQWDALMEIAKRWAKMDHRREVSSSEEEDEENFIDDGQTEATEDPRDVEQESALSALESAPEPAHPRSSTSMPATPPPSAPDPVPAVPSTSYLQSPTADKRKRMQELAEQRKRKKGPR